MAKSKLPKGSGRPPHFLYQEYLATLSTSEIDGIKQDKSRALHGFRKFVQNLSDEKLLKLIG